MHDAYTSPIASSTVESSNSASPTIRFSSFLIASSVGLSSAWPVITFMKAENAKCSTGYFGLADDMDEIPMRCLSYLLKEEIDVQTNDSQVLIESIIFPSLEHL
jgi:hypothetical protein